MQPDLQARLAGLSPGPQDLVGLGPVPHEHPEPWGATALRRSLPQGGEDPRRRAVPRVRVLRGFDGRTREGPRDFLSGCPGRGELPRRRYGNRPPAGAGAVVRRVGRVRVAPRERPADGGPLRPSAPVDGGRYGGGPRAPVLRPVLPGAARASRAGGAPSSPELHRPLPEGKLLSGGKRAGLEPLGDRRARSGRFSPGGGMPPRGEQVQAPPRNPEGGRAGRFLGPRHDEHAEGVAEHPGSDAAKTVVRTASIRPRDLGGRRRRTTTAAGVFLLPVLFRHPPSELREARAAKGGSGATNGNPTR
mmetsp:Transcript_9275/g.22766  ORF Transcript_9275/g.22766 Transcript_9275/m.22766 type:complete len:304 (-) Transcript_9275:457-1368(-)